MTVHGGRGVGKERAGHSQACLLSLNSIFSTAVRGSALGWPDTDLTQQGTSYVLQLPPEILK